MTEQDITVRLLLGGASLIYLTLGTLHLVYTFFTDRFQPHDRAVARAMEGTWPRLTKNTTLWKAWIGFNASHGTGAMFFGFMIGFAAVLNLRLYAGSQIIQIVMLANSLFYLWLARKYWFRISLVGITLATVLQVAALVVIYT